jgi:hypothetical protein
MHGSVCAARQDPHDGTANGNIAALIAYHQARHLENPVLKAFAGQVLDRLDADGCWL